MRSKIKIQIFSLILVVTTLLLFVFDIYFKCKNEPTPKKKDILWDPIDLDDLDYDATTNSLLLISNYVNNSSSIRIVNANQWIINNLIAQYSSRIVIIGDNKLKFECLAFYDHINQTSEVVLKNVNFLVRFASGELVFFNLDNVAAIITNLKRLGVTRYIWKFRAEVELNYDLDDLKSIVFLATDFREYQILLALATAPSDLENLLTFQKPVIYDARVKKKPAIGHCVHMVRDLNKRMNQIKNWLNIQQRFGIDTVRLYFYKVEKSAEVQVRKFIDENKGKMKIEIVNFKFPRYEETCEAQLSLFKSNPKSAQANHIMVRCREFFFTHMGDHWPAFHAQEFVCTNDCLASFKYTHEFVTNYDFDEFILPRHHLPTLNLSFAKSIECSTSKKKISPQLKKSDYDLYKYVRTIIDGAVNTTKKVASLHFEHMLLFDYMPDSFMSNLMNASRLNESRRILFDYKNMQMNFNFETETDVPTRNWMTSLGPIIKCLDGVINGTKIDTKWNRVHAIWMDVRKGKSVYNTDYAEYINQHFVNQVSDAEAKSIAVPVDNGFVSHFRDPIDVQFFLGQTYSLKHHYRLDMEYYYFIASFFQAFNQKGL